MEQDTLTSPGEDCDVCLIPHDDEVHAATLSLRRWFRYQVTKRLYDDEEEPAALPAA